MTHARIEPTLRSAWTTTFYGQKFYEEKTMNRTGLFIGISVLVLAAAVVAGSMIIAQVEADDDDRVFTNESIKGRWGFSAQGTILPPAVPVPTVAAAVGILEFDGVGDKARQFPGARGLNVAAMYGHRDNDSGRTWRRRTGKRRG